jgi:hypothetical protein
LSTDGGLRSTLSFLRHTEALEQDTPIDSIAPQFTAMGHMEVLHVLESSEHIIEMTKRGYIGADPRRDGNVLGD